MIRLTFPDINPHPWTPGTIGYGKGGRKFMMKDGDLDVYQKALKSTLADSYPDLPKFPEGTPLSVHFFFWRNTTKGQPADATNLQKATEDALQGLVYVNDRHNVSVGSVIVEQAPDTEPRVEVFITRQVGPRRPPANEHLFLLERTPVTPGCTAAWPENWSPESD